MNACKPRTSKVRDEKEKEQKWRRAFVYLIRVIEVLKTQVKIWSKAEAMAIQTLKNKRCFNQTTKPT